MEPNFQVGDPVETLENPKGFGVVTHANSGYEAGSDAPSPHPLLGVRMLGEKAGLAFRTDELRLCKCKDRIPLGVSQCQT